MRLNSVTGESLRVSWILKVLLLGWGGTRSEVELCMKTVSLSILDWTQLVSLSDEVHLHQQVEQDLVLKHSRSNMMSHGESLLNMRS